MILGGGPGGYSCALRCADLGATVALVESAEVGGTCLHRGCVPTRAMLHAASLADAAARSSGRWGVRASFDGVDMPTLKATRDGIVDRNRVAVERHLARGGIELIRGRGHVIDGRTIEVDGRRVSARRALVLAMGSTPRPMRSSDFDGHRILSSDDAMRLDRIPRSAVILGGGAIGAEFSQVWRAFGADVTLVERAARLIPAEDEDAGKELARSLQRHGIGVRTGAHVENLAIGEDEVRLDLALGEKVETLTAEVLLVAIGRSPLLSDDVIGALGIDRSEEGVRPGDWRTLETTVPGVFAVGDLLPPPSAARAHVAFAEGMLVADAIAGDRPKGIDYPGVPRLTHGLVESACVGLSEAGARAAGYDVEAAKMPLAAVAKGLILGEPGMVKLVAERGGPILGVHLVGPDVGELAGEAAAAIDFEASPAELASVVHPHPTLAEGIAELALALAGRPLHRR